MTLWDFLLILGIPTALTAFCLWRLERKISQSEKRREIRDDTFIKNQILIMQGQNATFALGEVTARAIKEVSHSKLSQPIATELSVALDHVKSIRQEQEMFLTETSAKHLYSKGA